MSMNAPEAVQTTRTGPESSEIGNVYTFIVADNNICDVTPPGDNQTYLFIELPGDGSYFPYYLPGGDLMS